MPDEVGRHSTRFVRDAVSAHCRTQCPALQAAVGQKRKIMAQCQDHLNALREAVRTALETTR